MVLTFSNIALGASTDSNFRLGVGAGITYGYNGINSEYLISDHYAFTAGLGYPSDFSELCWLLGGRIYFLDKSHKVRPRLGVYYGSILKRYSHWNDELVSSETYKITTGGLIGIGLNIKLSNCLSLDPEIVYKFQDIDNDLYLAMGLHW